MDRCLPRGSSRVAQMWRTALAVAFCGLLRGVEVGLPDNVTFSLRCTASRMLTCGSCAATGKLLTGKTVTVFLESGGTLLDP
eukprot:812380-Prymnesium_polylepis.1